MSPLQDPCQFAYRAKRSVDDAILISFNNIYKHIDIPKQYCRVLFVDFSSAFNTIQPHVLLPKLHDLKVNRNIIAWILDFLSEREQFVKLANVIQASPSLDQVKKRTHLESSTAFSDKIVSNTGAPQGCVLSPILFTIYTNDCTSKDKDNVSLLKFADDSTIQGFIVDDDESIYKKTIDYFVQWCD